MQAQKSFALATIVSSDAEDGHFPIDADVGGLPVRKYVAGTTDLLTYLGFDFLHSFGN